jgi:hypothetical protein
MAARRYGGPIQRQAIKVLRAMGIASSTEIMLHTHPKLGCKQHKSKSLRRALREIAERVGRAEGMGRPWRLRSSCPKNGWHSV